MRLTVTICTWNRAERLRAALESLTRCAPPRDLDWRVLVVDNGSTDRTADVVAHYQRVLALDSVVEPSPGLSKARNRALREIGDGYIAWIDDDCIVEEGWLRAYAEAFHRWPAAAVFGGPIAPFLEGDPPDWLRRVLPRVAFAYAALDLGPVPIPLGPGIDRLPFGANFVVKASAVGGLRFPESLGRTQDGRVTGGEEIALLRKLVGRGAEARWVPGAGVSHRIGPERQTARYLRSYADDDAFQAVVGAGSSYADPGRLRLQAGLTFARLRYLTRRLLAPADVWVGDLLDVGAASGRSRAHARLRARR